jgi:hypothetical protein
LVARALTGRTVKTTLETSGEDVKLHSIPVERLENFQETFRNVHPLLIQNAAMLLGRQKVEV